MSTARARYKSNVVSKGNAVFNTGIPIAGNGGVINIGSFYVEDIVRKRSEGDNQYFFVEHYTQEGGTLNGNSPSAKFTNFYGTVYDNWNNFPHHTNLPGNPSDTVAAVNAVARTNPSRPYVDVAAEVLQMVDLIHLLRRAGKSALKRLASGNLSIQFGASPLMGMSLKLFKFADQLDRRLKEMKRLQSGTGFRKTTSHGTFSASGSYFKTIQSQGVFINKPFFANTKEVIRSHSRWIPSGDFGSLDHHHLRLLTSDIMLGMKNGNLVMDLATLWQVIPWSWLIDWGGDVSAFFYANRNLVNATFGGVTVMRETTTTYTEPGGTVAGVRHSPVTIIRTTKKRNRISLSPTAQFPLLNGNQMGILASLAVLRGR